jgi:hypothetical protein
MKKLNVFVALLAFLGWMSGCSVYMAAKQPDQKDLDVPQVNR